MSFLKDLPSIYDQNQGLREENQSLKLVLKNYTDDQKILGAVTTFPKSLPLRLVGEGSELLFTSKITTDIKIGQPVVVGKQLMGIVKEVSSRLIKVTPVTNPNLKLMVQFESGLKGNYLVDKDVPIATSLPNDSIYSPNTLVLTLPTDLIPENLIIGEIDQVISSSADPFQKVKIKISKPTDPNYFLILEP